MLWEMGLDHNLSLKRYFGHVVTLNSQLRDTMLIQIKHDHKLEGRQKIHFNPLRINLSIEAVNVF